MVARPAASAIARTSPRDRGAEAERFVERRVRAALTADYLVFPNVAWLAPAEHGKPAADGEADLVIAHPEYGLLVLEVKSGRIRRDAHNRWWSGAHELPISPFEQAKRSKHALVRKLLAHPSWGGGEPYAGHGVVLTEADRTDAPRSLGMGPDAPPEIIVLASDLESPFGIQRAVARLYAQAMGDGRQASPLGIHNLPLVSDVLAPVREARPVLRHESVEGEREVVELTENQLRLFDRMRRQRRLDIEGCAGSGKTVIAKTLARRLAGEGFRTLLLCFNQPLHRALREELTDVRATGRLEVSTFHELCRTLGRQAGTLPAEPKEKEQSWWDEVLPRALAQAIDAAPERRFDALIVDEGQDFEPEWLMLVQLLLSDPDRDPFYVFHDPGQALYRPDAVAQLGLPVYELNENCRNPPGVHRLASRFYRGGRPTEAWRTSGREPDIRVVEPGRQTVEELGRVLHELVVDEEMRPWQIVVLTGVPLRESEVWRQRVFGNQVLWNGNYDESGRSLGLAADEVPEQPSDTILCDSVRRFKGLEREAIVLVELRPDERDLDALLYVGITRAKQHLIAIVPPALSSALQLGSPATGSRRQVEAPADS